MTPLAVWDTMTGQARISSTGRVVDLGGWSGWLHVGMWPQDPEHLLFLSGDGSCGGDGLRGLRSVDLVNGNALDQIWEAADLLPPELLLASPDATRWPWSFQTGADDDGNPALLLGVGDGGCQNPPLNALVAWDASAGPRWTAPLDQPGWPMSATFAAWNGGGALRVAIDPYDGSWGWTFHGPDGEQMGALETGPWQYRPGPVFDPAGPTFAVISTISDETWGQKDVVDVYHRGEKIWRIDGLQFGLAERVVSLQDLVLLPPVPED